MKNLITFDNWFDKYKPILNHFTSSPDDEQFMFETDGDELDHIVEQKDNYIWTLIEGENENRWILPGYHIVNRLGYYITKKSYKDNSIIVNDNSMMTVNDAKYNCIKFLESINIKLTNDQEFEIHNFYSQLM